MLGKLNASGVGFLWRGMGWGGGTYKLHMGHFRLTSTRGAAEGRPTVEIFLVWLMCSLYLPPPLPKPY